jgi:hypothetical protein
LKQKIKLLISKLQLLLKNKKRHHHFKIFLLLIYATTINVIFITEVKSQHQVSIDVFYRELSPYGTWIQNNEYGFVWVPHHHDNFYPYSSGGYWLFTEYGWTWVSSYSWGWAPFHYGRWFYDSFYGWVWVPGYNWGAAWVTWRYCPGYYGWAPLGPDIGYDFAFSNGYYLPHEQWHFIHQHDLGRRDVDKRILGMGGYIKYLNDSKVIDNVKHDEHQQISYHAGPARNEVERITGKKINALAIENATTPVQLVRKSSLKIYRPELQSEKLQPAAIAPKKFENWKGAANPKKADKIEDQPPVKQLPEKEIRQPEKPVPEKIPPKQEQQRPIKQEPVILEPEKEIRQPVKPVPERITPKQEQQVPEKEKPVIQPRQQEIPRQEIQHTEPKTIPPKETRPIIEAPPKSKPIEQRPSRQRINEIPQNNNQPPVKKMTPQEMPVLKQSIPIKRRP